MSVDDLISLLTYLSRAGYGKLPVTTPDPESGTAMDLCAPVVIDRNGENLLDTPQAVSLITS